MLTDLANITPQDVLSGKSMLNEALTKDPSKCELLKSKEKEIIEYYERICSDGAYREMSRGQLICITKEEIKLLPVNTKDEQIYKDYVQFMAALSMAELDCNEHNADDIEETAKMQIIENLRIFIKEKLLLGLQVNADGYNDAECVLTYMFTECKKDKDGILLLSTLIPKNMQQSSEVNTESESETEPESKDGNHIVISSREQSVKLRPT